MEDDFRGLTVYSERSDWWTERSACCVFLPFHYASTFRWKRLLVVLLRKYEYPSSQPGSSYGDAPQVAEKQTVAHAFFFFFFKIAEKKAL